MVEFGENDEYYQGLIHKLYITESCHLSLKRSGLFLRVLARLKKVCDTDHFGQEKTGYKFLEDENIGWFKWKNGTRVYFSKFKGEIILLSVSGNKNSQEKDISKAKEVRDEYTD